MPDTMNSFPDTALTERPNRFGFIEGPDDRLPVPDEKEAVKIPGWHIFPLTSLISTFLLLVFGMLAHWWVMLPILGMKVSFVVGSIILWLAVQRLLLFIQRRFPSKELLAAIAGINRSTGLKWVDYAGLLISIVTAIILLIRSPLLSPYAIYAILAFLTFIKIAPEEWPTRPRSGRRENLPKPEEPGVTVPDEKDVVAVPFTWTLKVGSTQETHQFGFRLAISRQRYTEYQSRNPFASASSGNLFQDHGYATLVKELIGKGITPEVEYSASNLVKLSEAKNLNPYDEANNVLAFVGSIEYAKDPDDRDYWRYPIETLLDRQGDCDCHAILAAAAYWLMGYECVILISEKLGHMACAIGGADGFPQSERFYRSTSHGNRAFFFCETTSSESRVGEMPDGMSSSDFQELEIC